MTAAADLKEHQRKQDLKKLEDKYVGLSQSLDHAINMIGQKEEEIQHLKSLLGNVMPVVGQLSPMMISDEEMIAIKQLDLLRKEALLRPLTLDEVKKAETLQKIKRTAQEKPKDYQSPPSKIKQLATTDLLLLAIETSDKE